MAIKLTAEGLVILKAGLPSCTCCDGGGDPCDPNVTTIYVEYIEDPLGTPTTTYFELTGGLNEGLFSGTGPNGTVDLEWDTTAPGTWFLSDILGGAVPAVADRCDPTGFYADSDSPDNEWYMTLSFTSLP